MQVCVELYKKHFSLLCTSKEGEKGGEEMSWVFMKRDYTREVEKASAHKTAFLFKEGNTVVCSYSFSIKYHQ